MTWSKTAGVLASGSVVLSLGCGAAPVAGSSPDQDGQTASLLKESETPPTVTQETPATETTVAGVPLVESTAPIEFSERSILAPCGTLILDQGETLDGTPEQACMNAAILSMEGAELSLQWPTVEGDPIIEYYRSLPDDAGFELFTDSTRDAFDSRAWTLIRCTGVVTMNNLGNCTDAELSY